MEWLRDGDDARVVDALGRSCDVCQVGVGVWCVNSVRGGELPDRLVHFGRLVAR